jgi:hypothetical protein
VVAQAIRLGLASGKRIVCWEEVSPDASDKSVYSCESLRVGR